MTLSFGNIFEHSPFDIYLSLLFVLNVFFKKAFISFAVSWIISVLVPADVWRSTSCKNTAVR